MTRVLRESGVAVCRDLETTGFDGELGAAQRAGRRAGGVAAGGRRWRREKEKGKEIKGDQQSGCCQL